MFIDQKAYGLRNQRTGDLARVETYEYHDEGSSHTERTLVVDKLYPVYQSSDLKDLIRGRYHREFYGIDAPRFDDLMCRLGDIGEYEIVEFSPVSAPGDGRDPDRLSIEVRALEFRLADNVRIKRYGEKDAASFMASAFPNVDPEAFHDFTMSPVVLVGENAADLAGSIIVPSAEKLLLRADAPSGVLMTKTVGDTTFALITNDLSRPELRAVLPPPDPEIDDVPWGDCKVAYGWDGTDEADDLLNDIWDEEVRDRASSIWPQGWSINETDASGVRCVVVFRVEGKLPTREDGERVQELISTIEQGVDPRAEVAPAFGR